MEKENGHGSQVAPTPTFTARLQSSNSYADVVKHTNDSHRKGIGKPFWKHSDQPKWTPGKFVSTFVITVVASFLG